jgi:dissimilatory sulfite reductase (desulfoviridin) alpha/beta subunit
MKRVYCTLHAYKIEESKQKVQSKKCLKSKTCGQRCTKIHTEYKLNQVSYVDFEVKL